MNHSINYWRNGEDKSYLSYSIDVRRMLILGLLSWWTLTKMIHWRLELLLRMRSELLLLLYHVMYKVGWKCWYASLITVKYKKKLRINVHSHNSKWNMVHIWNTLSFLHTCKKSHLFKLNLTKIFKLYCYQRKMCINNV